jgi:16S rRNA (adenine1518-N6/adenine1519-N6)-dimethyltransferase
VNAPDFPSLAAVIDACGLRAKKSLGQHFLTDSNLLAKIVRSAGDLTGVSVMEIGPGPGGLTRALLASNAARVVAIEKDARCLPALQPLVDHYAGRLSVIEADAMHTLPQNHLQPPYALIANLPYNVGTAMVVQWLRALRDPALTPWHSLTVMLQKEVAERLVARVGDSGYGRLSVLAGWLTEAEILFDVPPGAFTPPPKVTSSIVQLRPRVPQPEGPALEALERVVAAAFGQRRKMLRSSLKSLGVDAEALCAKAGIAHTLRADALSVEQFCALTQAQA